MNLKKQYLFVKKLETLYKSGRPVIESLESLARNERSLMLRSAFLQISKELKGGSSLGAALMKNDDNLDVVYSKLIHVGEIAGKLEMVFSHILELQGSLISLRRKIIAASIYPIAVLAVYTFLFALLIFFVIPMMTSFMQTYNYPVPGILQSITAFNAFLFSPWGLIGIPITIFLAFILIYIYLNIDSLAMFRSVTLLYVPGFGRLEKLNNLFSYIFTMKIAYESGLSTIEAAELATYNVNNAYLFEIFSSAYLEIKNGAKVSTALNKTNLFDFDIIDLIRVGEDSGKLEESYKEIINIIDTKINTTIAVMVAMIKPLGVLVGLLLLASIFVGLGLILSGAFSQIKNLLPH